MNSKSKITAAPSALAHLIGKEGTLSGVPGARGTGTERFDIPNGGSVFVGGDSGIETQQL